MGRRTKGRKGSKEGGETHGSARLGRLYLFLSLLRLHGQVVMCRFSLTHTHSCLQAWCVLLEMKFGLRCCPCSRFSAPKCFAVYGQSGSANHEFRGRWLLAGHRQMEVVMRTPVQASGFLSFRPEHIQQRHADTQCIRTGALSPCA